MMLGSGASDIDQVREIQFSVLTAQQIRDRSVCEVTSADTYINNAPVPGGLYDPRMGVVDYVMRCATCHNDNRTCPGHPGHIELAAPMFNAIYVDMVRKLLRCICINCSHSLIDDDSIVPKRKANPKRFNLAEKECLKVKNCPTCGSKTADKITWDKQAKMTMEWKSDGTNEAVSRALFASDIDAIFSKIPDNSCYAMYLDPRQCRPESMMFKALPVPPIAVRPPGKTGPGQRRDDDLTHKLNDIVKHNKVLKSKLSGESKADVIEQLVILLQLDVLQYIDNSQTGVIKARMKANNRPLRCIASRLKGKEGRVRGNLMGKRVNFSARSVITPDPNISVEELGVPLKIAMIETFPETVTAHNIDRLRDMVFNGPNNYPGARNVWQNGISIDLRRAEKRIRMEISEGDVVDRHLMNGDFVLFNRQPSLHRMSMMAHKVRVMNYDTFRLSVMVTPPYNADFDGDEMNMHVPQSVTTEQEIAALAGVKSQILTPRKHEPIIGVVQDVALGTYLITQDKVRIDKKMMFNLMAHFSTSDGVPPALKDGETSYTGQQAFSQIMPASLHVDVGGTKIVSGDLVAGQVTKKLYQMQTTGILHSVYNDDGNMAAVHMLDNTQNLACDWLMQNGFSVGIGDLYTDAATRAEMAETLKTAKEAVHLLITSIHDGSFVNDSNKSDDVEFERVTRQVLAEAGDKVGKMAIENTSAAGSRLMDMIKSGSKGAEKNVTQMAGCLAQQIVEGHLPPLSYDGRTLPHFERYDNRPEARGFIESSFLKGLDPHEFFFHAMAGREGLIDTAVKSVTGDTPIIVLEDGECKYVKIGDWIDQYLSDNAEDVAHFEKRRMELLDIDNDIHIPTTDENGNVTWGQITAMTRHDPGTELYEIKTQAGKSVIVTESKSLLIWHPDLNKFKEVLTPEIKVGHFVPVTMELTTPPTTTQPASRIEGVRIGAQIASGTLDWVPTSAFTAPEEYIIGLLSGFFSETGFITIDSLSVTVSSKRLAEGISMLCSRLGIFAQIDGTRVAIRAQWATMFAEKVELVSESRQTMLKSLRAAKTHPDFTSHNNVILDKIVEINIVGVEKYPKVYDLTIPSTLNFGLANGLQVRDTSETGYIQRKLIKALEDCKVAYDRSVRNAGGSIVQFLFGEDGMDACSIEQQFFPTMPIDSYSAIAVEYLLTSGDLDSLAGRMTEKALEVLKKQLSGDTAKRLEAHFDTLIEDKQRLVDSKACKDSKGELHIAIAYDRILWRAARLTCPEGFLSDLDVEEAMDMCDRITALYGKNWTIGAAMARAQLSPKRLLMRYKFDKKGLAYAEDVLTRTYHAGLASPSDMVGIVAAQSIAEPATQMVLNSVTWDTELLISVDGILTKTTIGKFTDDYMERTKGTTDLEVHPHDTHLAWIKDRDIKIGSVDEEGKAHWTQVEACTRHPVVNEDGSNTVYKVRVQSGAEVTVTRAKGLLKRINNKIVKATVDDYAVGDYMPMAATLQPDVPEISTLNLIDWISPRKALFMSEAKKAIDFYAKRPVSGPCPENKTGRNSRWWIFGQGSIFTLPFKRSDVFTASFGIGNCASQVTGERREGCVYPIKLPNSSTMSAAHIPETLPLDSELGFFFGAYIAEGHVVKRESKKTDCVSYVAVIISNNVEAYTDRIVRLIEKWGVAHHVTECDKFDKYGKALGHTRSVRITSTILGELMAHTCGVLSPNKKIPARFLQAPESFRKGLVDGYFSGDGHVGDAKVTAASVSKPLLDDLKALLMTFGVRCRISENLAAVAQAAKKGLKGSRCWELRIGRYDSAVFARTFTSIIDYKQAALDVLKEYTDEWRYMDTIPDVILEGRPAENIVMKRIMQMLATGTYIHPNRKKGPALNDDDKLVLQDIVDSQTWFDKIISIEATTPPNEYPLMYDLTVAGTRNFNTHALVPTFDTFHHSGTGDGSIGGVPRIRELLNNTKNPKTPLMTIYLQEPLNKSPETAKIIRDKLHATYVKDLVQSVSLVYDSADFTSESAEDARIVRLYEAFGVNTITPQEAPWMLRLQFDRLKMIESNATMMDVFRSIDKVTNVTVVASDDAASELIMRLRPPTSNGTDMVSELALFEDKILGIRVKGVMGTNSAKIKEADETGMYYNSTTGVFEKRDEWSISAEGSNIESVFNIPGVDFKRTVTNNVMAVYDRLGIEAARNVLLSEFTLLYSGGTYADYRHVILLVDFMAQSGKVMPVSRHTMNSSDVGPLAKCSYEETVTNLASAGMYGEIDRIDGVSANIMLGQVVPCGTGDTILLLDNDQLEDIEGEVAKKIEAGVISLGADMILDLAMQFNPLLSSSQMKPWLNISMDSIVIQTV